MAGFWCVQWPRPVQNSRPAQRRVRPKQGGAVLRPSNQQYDPISMCCIKVYLHQGLAVVRPSIPVSMCCCPPGCSLLPHVPALLTSTPPEFQDWMRNRPSQHVHHSTI